MHLNMLSVKITVILYRPHCVKEKKSAVQKSTHPMCTGMILGLRPANERWCYFVTTSLIGWAQT